MAAGKLVQLFDINLPSTVIYSLVCPEAHLEQPRVDALRDWMITAAKLDNVQADTQTGLVQVKTAG